MRDAEARAIDRDEPIDAALQLRVEEMLHATQVPEAFFAHRADEGHRTGGGDLRGVHRTCHGEHDGKAAAVVPDAGALQHRAVARHAHVGPFREHRVEVRAQDDVRPRALPGPLAEHVADPVDADVLQADGLERAPVGLGPLTLLEGGRRNLAQPDLLVDERRFRCDERFDGGGHFGPGEQPPANPVRILLGVSTSREHARRRQSTPHQTSRHPHLLPRNRIASQPGPPTRRGPDDCDSPAFKQRRRYNRGVVRRVALIVTLAGLLAVLQVVHVRTLLRNGPNPFLPIDIRNGEVVVDDVAVQDGFDPIARFHHAGLRKDDVIEAAYTVTGQGGRVDSLRVLLDVASSAGASGAMTLHVRRPSEGGRRLTIVVPPRGRERVALFLFLGWSVLVPCAALVAALLLGLLKPEDTRAFVGSLMFLSLAGSLTLDVLMLESRWILPIVAGQALSLFATYLLFLWFFLIFPTPSPIERRYPWLKYAALACLAVVAVFNIALVSTAFTSLAEFDRRWGALNRAWYSALIGAVAGVPVVIGLVSLVLNTRRLKSRDERRRMLIVLVGALVGLGPLMMVQVYCGVRDQVVPLPVAAVVVILLSLFPISFVYAVVRHRVLGIRLILRRGVKYALVSAGFRLLLAAVIFAILVVMLGTGATPATRDPVAAVAIAAAAAFVAARVFRSVSRRVMSSIDRRFFRDAYDARIVLSSLSHSIRQLLLDPDGLSNEVANAVSATLHPRTVAIFLHQEQGADGASGAYRCAAIRCHEGVMLDAAELALPASGVLATRLSPDEDLPRLRAWDVFPDEPRSWAHALRTGAHAKERAVIEKLGALLAVPISAGARLVGVLLLGEKRSEEHYSRDDRDLLVTVAEQVGLALDYGQLARQAAREESLQKEIEIARTVQARLFPQTLPPVAGVDYSGICRPAREVGGDSFDFIALDAGRLGLAVGDISGKGVAAALIMANLQALLRSRAPLRGDDLRDLMADINRLLVASIPDNRFATYFYGVLDPARRLLTYVNAGHNPPMLLRNGAANAAPTPIVRLEPTGTMLGMFPEMAFDQRQVDVAPGDLLLAYSDGICDALNEHGEDYGDARLETVVRSHAGLSAVRLQERILDDVASFGHGVAPFDDMTLVVAKLT